MKKIDIKVSKLDVIGKLLRFIGFYLLIFGLYQLYGINNEMWWYGFIVATGAMAVTIGFAIACDCGIHDKDSEDE
ncbi:hypothetical protein [Clostridium sp. AF22-10]|uniref:hypothetical protein n=1 Tax=Clostridium sp. AF22-10 TaxID=2293004 RepID=UPI000E4EA073|nr:hypothetical protein DWX91_15655 [Clostridium sp. AF22-10]